MILRHSIGIGRTLSSTSIKRDYYRGSQDSLAIRGNEELLFFRKNVLLFPAFYVCFGIIWWIMIIMWSRLIIVVEV